jgi:hypothetical protein
VASLWEVGRLAEAREAAAHGLTLAPDHAIHTLRAYDALHRVLAGESAIPANRGGAAIDRGLDALALAVLAAREHTASEIGVWLDAVLPHLTRASEAAKLDRGVRPAYRAALDRILEGRPAGERWEIRQRVPPLWS